MGRRKIKGNMDIELAVDAMEMAENLDHMVLFSGDGDFRSLVEAVQRRGVRVSVVSTITTQPPMVADELRRQADEFIDLVHLIGKVGRDGERPERAPRSMERRTLHANSYAAHAPAARRTPARPTDDSGRRIGGGAAARIVRSAPGSSPSAPPASCAIRAATTPRCDRFGPSDARVLVVGLAPGRDGANRTGRPFTGDWAGDLLYETLGRFGFSAGHYDERPDDGLVLMDCMVTNAVRCVPPENKPVPAEIATCRRFLVERMADLPRLRAIVALGRIAHESAARARDTEICPQARRRALRPWRDPPGRARRPRAPAL